MPAFQWLVLAISMALATVGVVALLTATRRVRRHAGYVATVREAALTDPLTGLLNRRGFLDELDRELARGRRHGRRFVLAYVDVRGLKAVNDSDGHLAGDALLRETARLLRESARADDVAGRLGGDELGLLLVEQGAEGAEAVVERIRRQVPKRRQALGLSSEWDLTVGTAAFPDDGQTADVLLAIADRRLYEQRGISLGRRPRRWLPEIRRGQRQRDRRAR